MEGLKVTCQLLQSLHSKPLLGWAHGPNFAAPQLFLAAGRHDSCCEMHHEVFEGHIGLQFMSWRARILSSQGKPPCSKKAECASSQRNKHIVCSTPVQYNIACFTQWLVMFLLSLPSVFFLHFSLFQPGSFKGSPGICLKTPIERGSEARFGRGW